MFPVLLFQKAKKVSTHENMATYGVVCHQQKISESLELPRVLLFMKGEKVSTHGGIGLICQHKGCKHKGTTTSYKSLR